MRLLDMAKLFLSEAIRPDDTLVDFTMGNGHDTLYLSGLVPEGRVYAFDVQKEAIENTAALLKTAGKENAVLIHDGHQNVKKYVTGPIGGGMFNLGYRPGGDKTKHTLCETTLTAVRAGVELLRPGGILVISVYPGHAEGTREGEELLSLFSGFDRKLFSVMCHRMVNASDAPFIFVCEKYNKTANGAG